MRDGDSETRNGINYQLKQTVTDRKMSTYSNVLNINSTSGSISEYACTVSNVWTNDTKRSEVRGKLILQYSSDRKLFNIIIIVQQLSLLLVLKHLGGSTTSLVMLLELLMSLLSTLGLVLA